MTPGAADGADESDGSGDADDPERSERGDRPGGCGDGDDPDRTGDAGRGSAGDGRGGPTDREGDRAATDARDRRDADLSRWARTEGTTDSLSARSGRSAGAGDDGTDDDRSGDAPREAGASGESTDDADPVELGVALLSRLEHEELSVADAIDRIEAVTTVPSTQRQILETAERREIVERDGATIRPRGDGYVSFGREVVSRDGEFTCRRCGAALSTGYFIQLDPGEVGPYGSSCVRRVTGRE